MSDLPPLLPLEIAVLDRLRNTFPDFDPYTWEAIPLAFDRLRDLFLQIARWSSSAHEGQLALMGLTNHTYLLFMGGMQQLCEGNAHVWSTCARGLMETFGALVYVLERPKTLPNILEHGIPAGKLRAAAERGQPGLGNDIDRLSNIVHPGSRAVFAGFTITDEEKSEATFFLGPRNYQTSEAQSGLQVLVNAVYFITKRLEEIITKKPEMLTMGKVVMQLAV